VKYELKGGGGVKEYLKVGRGEESKEEVYGKARSCRGEGGGWST
jgi:hypothetical protein